MVLRSLIGCQHRSSGPWAQVETCEFQPCRHSAVGRSKLQMGGQKAGYTGGQLQCGGGGIPPALLVLSQPSALIEFFCIVSNSLHLGLLFVLSLVLGRAVWETADAESWKHSAVALCRNRITNSYARAAPQLYSDSGCCQPEQAGACAATQPEALWPKGAGPGGQAESIEGL